MAVLRPLKVVIENYPEGEGELLDAVNNPEDPAAGSRKVRFTRELYVERDDFMETPEKKFFRLFPGNEVRLRYAYFVTCREVVKDAAGEVVELRCTYDPGDPRRRDPARRAEGQGDAALGFGGGCGSGRGAPLQSALHDARARAGKLRREPQPGLVRGAGRLHARAVDRGATMSRARSSSSGSAISSATATRSRAARSSTASSAFATATPGRPPAASG